ncbi:Wzz/FepE/Etk N-terminal domain-containing protein [Actinomadura sp. 3N407]|uniref:Wzz/FepE/Etk N-terminal domain-containing protein n=1 Tax=Actinomadura sp. 3N407 TaxID=3457423 RepID=UPI003FCC77FF
MDGTPPADSGELAEYLTLLRRRWLIITGSTLAFLALSVAAFLLMPRTYESQSVIQVKPIDQSADDRDRPREVDTTSEAQRLRSTEVAARAAKIMSTGATPSELLGAMGVTALPDSSVLEVTWTGATPQEAQKGAQAFAQAFLADRLERGQQQYKTEAASLREQINKLRQHDQAQTRQMARATGAEGSALRAERQLTRNQISALSERLTATNIAAANIDPGGIITNAERPGSAATPKATLYLPGGLAIGLLLGLVTAVIRDRTDTRVRGALDLERRLGLPVLYQPPSGHKATELGLVQSRSRVGQSFHELAHSIGATLGHGNHVILVTGATPGASTSVVAANLAASLARVESQALLVCADLQSQACAHLLQVPAQPGLADALVSKIKLSKIVRSAPPLPSLWVIPAGAETDLAFDMLQRDRMGEILKVLRRKADYIVVEAPSTAVSADAQALADQADAVLLVVESGTARYEQVRDGLRQFDRMRTVVLGAAVVPRQSKIPTAERPARAMPRTPGRRPPNDAQDLDDHYEDPSADHGVSSTTETLTDNTMQMARIEPPPLDPPVKRSPSGTMSTSSQPPPRKSDPLAAPTELDPEPTPVKDESDHPRSSRR